MMKRQDLILIRGSLDTFPIFLDRSSRHTPLSKFFDPPQKWRQHDPFERVEHIMVRFSMTNLKIVFAFISGK